MNNCVHEVSIKVLWMLQLKCAAQLGDFSGRFLFLILARLIALHGRISALNEFQLKYLNV